MSRNTQTLLYLGPIVNCQPLWLHKFHWLHSAAVTASSCVSLDYHCDCYRTPHQCRCTCTYTYHRTQAPQLTRHLRCQLLSLCFPIWRLDFRYRIRGYRNSWNYLYNMENILKYCKKNYLIIWENISLSTDGCYALQLTGSGSGSQPLCRCTAGSTSPGFPPLSLHYSQHLSHGESSSICLILLYLGSSIFPDDTTIVEVNRCWQLFIFESQHLHIHYPPQCFLLLIMIWK